MREFISWLKEEESGQGMVEYGVIMVIVIAIAIAWKLFCTEKTSMQHGRK